MDKKKNNKKIEGVRFYRWGGFSFGDVPDYVLCEDRKTHREIWVDIAEFKRGVRKFGYDCYTVEAEKFSLSPAQEARVEAYLQEYERVLDGYIHFLDALQRMRETTRRMEEECPTLYREYAEKVSGRLDAFKRRYNEGGAI